MKLFKKPCFLVLLAFACLPAFAQTAILKPSSAEDVVMAFYKSAGEKPSFDKWIKGNEPYSVTALALRSDVYKQELERLNKKWSELNKDKNYITIRTQARAHIESTPHLTVNLPATNTLVMTFAAGKDVEYIPYDFMEQRFAVVMNDIQKLMKQKLTPEQATSLSNAIGPQDSTYNFVLQLKPLKADTSGLMELDGFKQWVFLNEIASLSLWSPSGALLWEYSAPWFITPTTETLKGLYKDPNDKLKQ